MSSHNLKIFWRNWDHTLFRLSLDFQKKPKITILVCWIARNSLLNMLCIIWHYYFWNNLLLHLSFLKVTRLDSISNHKIGKFLCLVDLWVLFLITCSLNFIAIIFAYVQTFLCFIIKTVHSLVPCFFAALSIPIQNTFIIILLIFCFTTAD